MADIYSQYGQDFVLNPSGGLQSATGWDEIEQYIQRVLLTNPIGQDSRGNFLMPDDVFNPTFGLGLKRQLGLPLTLGGQQAMQQKCIQAILANPAVSANPAPVVQITQPQPFVLQIFISLSPVNGTPGQIALEVTP